jgi:hypothetical protein
MSDSWKLAVVLECSCQSKESTNAIRIGVTQRAPLGVLPDRDNACPMLAIALRHGMIIYVAKEH